MASDVYSECVCNSGKYLTASSNCILIKVVSARKEGGNLVTMAFLRKQNVEEYYAEEMMKIFWNTKEETRGNLR